ATEEGLVRAANEATRLFGSPGSTVLSALFAVAQRSARGGQQWPGLAAAQRGLGGADAHGGVLRRSPHRDRRSPDAVADLLRDALSGAHAGVWQRDDELVAADPTDGIAVAQARSQSMDDLD